MAKAEKWFSMRTDFFGADASNLGIYLLTPQSVGLYVACVAYACKYDVDYVPSSIMRMWGGKRPKRPIDELVEHGFLTPRPDRRHFVEHEGTIWRRGTARGDRRAIPKSIRIFVMERDGWACVLCGVGHALTLDHIQPYSKGGSDEPSNLRVLCRSCNSKKGNRV